MEQGMPDSKEGGFDPFAGLRLKCSKCGDELPLAHPHIVAERQDEDGNMICEWCWMKQNAKKDT
jgi:hypothetical protein